MLPRLAVHHVVIPQPQKLFCASDARMSAYVGVSILLDLVLCSNMAMGMRSD